MASRLVVEWTRLTLRLALAEGGGIRWRLRTIHTQVNRAPEEAVETLRTLLKTTKISPADVVGIVPREQVITRVVKFPASDPTELTNMVELYAKAQLPYPREQTVMDFHVLSRQGGFSTVAVIACQREVIDRYVAILRGAGLSVNLLTLSPWGVLGWYRQAIKPQAAQEPCLVVNVDDARTDLVLIAEGRILSSRSVGQGASDWQAVGETTELLTAEVERSRASIRKELSNVDIRSVILTGSGVSAQWSEPLAQRIGLPVVAVEGQQAFKRCIIPTNPAISPVVIGGVAVSDVRSLLNVSPAEIRAQRRHRQQIRELVIVGLLLLTALVLGSALLGLQVSRQHRQAAELDHVLAAMQPAAKQVQDKSRSSQLVSSLLEDRRRLGQMLSGVLGATPQAITLEGLTFEHAKREMVIRGSATTTQDVLNYIAQLERLNGIKAVELRYSTRRSTPSGERTDFELVVSQRRAAS